MKPVRN